MNESVHRLLTTAKGLIKEPEKLHRGWFAWNGDDNCSADDPKAVAWCSVGACQKAMYTLGLRHQQADQAYDFLRKAMGDCNSVTYDSDRMSHAEVMVAFDKAIQLAAEYV